MANKLGAWQIGHNPNKGKVEFNIFFPDGWDPQISSIKVAGDFLNNNWNFQAGFPLIKRTISEGTIWSYKTDEELEKGFYQYKYLINFNNGESRIVSDPCTRYSGKDNQNAAFLIGGSQPEDNEIVPLRSGRKPIRDMIIYEISIADYIAECYKEKKAPFAAIIDKVDYIKELGFNAIEFMPWQGCGSSVYTWGYEPVHYFSVSYDYANSIDVPEEKISWLKKLISECHKNDIHVIMDGVYNHTSKDFPYKWMYLNVEDCPYTGIYEGSFSGLEDLDFNNTCTNEFIFDVCKYWIDEFKIDGFRLDNTVNYYRPGDPTGLKKLLENIYNYVFSIGETNFNLTIEHLDENACRVVNNTTATSFWDNSFYDFTFNALWWKNIDSRLLNTLNNQRFLNDANNVAILYHSNHDHSHLTFQAGARDNVGSMKWFKTQPYVIALFTSTAVPLVFAGTEFGEDHFIPENDEGTCRRIIPRPLRWKLCKDRIGIQLQKLYQRLANIRQEYEGLRSPNFYPNSWETWQKQFNPQGYGVDTLRQLAIYRRWGHTKTGALQEFIIVLNFSDNEQDINVPFPDNGQWTDLLSNYTGSWKPVINDYHLHFKIGSNWGHIFFKSF